ncbi:CBU_0592 family membrane protein [Pedobacter mendelii]|uniref:CBU_0592 family membrane protein n=1 Tax=Pedobacter mendelii TaxID=1908240 RepID=UPI003FCEDC6F
MPKVLLLIIGWIGVVLCTLGYFLLSMKVIRAESWIFQLLNIMGGLCLTVTALDTSDLPNAAANLLWMFIGVFALGKHLRSSRTNKS